MSDVQQDRFSGCWPWFSLAVLVALADQIVKEMVHTWMPFGQVIPLTPFFNWVYTGNTGAAFSLLSDAGGWQRYVFVGLALIVAVVLVVQLCKPITRLEAVAYSLILGGAMGNTADRLARGYVVDYLDVYWGQWHWPAFNLADIALFVGVFMYALTLWRERPSFKQPE